MEDLKIEYLPLGALTPYEGNARKHAEADVSGIAASIKEFGFDDPIGIWGENNVIVEGHGRLLAAKQLGMEKVPCIRLDHLSEEQRRAYALAHNKTAELSEWDFTLLDVELQGIENIDMSAFGFADPTAEDEGDGKNPYTDIVNIPQYEPSGEKPDLSSLCDFGKLQELVEGIEKADVSDTEKAFLMMAAHRHVVFNYKRIADYYAQASPEMQRLMEESALVIIDVNDAIAKGYAVLRNSVEELAFSGGIYD